MKMKKRIVSGVIGLAMIGGFAGAASAGEITGNGKATGMAGHAKSECGFSGQEDNPDSPLRTQTPHEVWFDLTPDPDTHFVANPPPGSPAQPGGCNPNKP